MEGLEALIFSGNRDERAKRLATLSEFIASVQDFGFPYERAKHSCRAKRVHLLC